MNGVRPSFWLFAAAAATFAAAAVHGTSSSQASAPPAPVATGQFKNLKILPADIPRDRLMLVMKGYATSLGVRCTFCHVGEEGKPLSTFDFASDANPHKDIARKMMLMVRRINEQDFKVTDWNQTKVNCYTCHRGAERPLFAAPPAVPPLAPAPSAPTTTERG